jgi:putative glutamine amidotransferase
MPPPSRPLIGLNTDFVPAGRAAAAHVRLDAGYFDAVLTAGGLPVLLPPLPREADLDALLDRLGGVLLVGGLDLNPARHGLTPHPRVQPLADRRDQSDLLLVRRVVQRRLPVLGIGLGAQQLNVALGGSLHLHLPDDVPRAIPHRDPGGGPHRHAVLIEPGTRLEEIYGGGEVRVNSGHHQAVRQPGRGLRVAALAPDGVVEAVEAADPDWFCVGVQWHPESETASALDTQLFECFVQACARQAAPLPLAA